MISRLRPLLLVIALGAAGCSDQLVNTRPEAIRGALWGNRALWNAQNLDDYRYTYDVVCPFCSTTGPLQVTVRDGQVVDVREEGGDALPREWWAGDFFTMDEIFDQLTEAQSRNEHTEVSYHRSLGYPVDVVIGNGNTRNVRVRMLSSDLTRIR